MVFKHRIRRGGIVGEPAAKAICGVARSKYSPTVSADEVAVRPRSEKSINAKVAMRLKGIVFIFIGYLVSGSVRTQRAHQAKRSYSNLNMSAARAIHRDDDAMHIGRGHWAKSIKSGSPLPGNPGRGVGGEGA